MRPETFAEELERAWEERRPIEPLSDRGLKGIEAAYRVQEAWNALRLGKGDRVVGRKIGLTSKAVQEQLGVDQPDFGNLWESRSLESFRSAACYDPKIRGERRWIPEPD